MGTNLKRKNIMRYIRYNTPIRRFPPASALGRGAWNGLESEIDRLFNAAVAGTRASAAKNRVPVDIYQDTNHAYVRAELPGFKRDAIKVEVVDGYLTLEATREGESEKAALAVKFNRSVRLSDDVQTDGIFAAYVDGILTVTLPKKEEAKPHKVTVAVK